MPALVCRKAMRLRLRSARQIHKLFMLAQLRMELLSKSKTGGRQ